MEAFVALGAAGNVLQFVDFTFKLLSETREIYCAHDGMAANVRLLDVVIEDVVNHNQLVLSSSPEDLKLRKLVAECDKLGKELLDGLNRLKTGAGQNKFTSLIVALKRVWKQNQIDDLLDRIARVQARIAHHVQFEIFTSVSAVSRRLEKLEDTSKTLDLDRKNELTQLKYGILDAVKKLLTTQGAKQPATIPRSSATDAPASTMEDYLQRQRKRVHDDPLRLTSISQDIQDVRLAFDRLADRSGVTMRDQDFLKSLYYSGIKSRQRKIDLAHSKTFEWIFRSSTLDNGDSDIDSDDGGPDKSSGSVVAPDINFVEWLTGQDSCVFWIHGKPGCGKSTLMKFICHHLEVMKSLQVWAGPKSLVVGSYFFWNAGSALQKSEEGLLRSLLFEILRQCRSLIPLARGTLPDADEFDEDGDRWSKEQLLTTYEAVIAHDMSRRFCFFIDGLDEYHGSNKRPGDLIKTIRDIHRSSDVKLCISSRPWTVFRDEFEHTPALLKVETLTRRDISRYVTDKFEEEAQYRILSERDRGYTDLAAQVSNRAQGVFLWVVLVVRELLDGFRHHDSVKTMRARLEAFPQDLDGFFQHMLESIDPFYSEQTTRTFETVVAAKRPLLAVLYSFLDDACEEVDSVPIIPEHPLGEDEISYRHQQMRRRLDGRTKGLLEIVPDGDERGAFYQLRVDFLHRTVRDFLRDSSSAHELFKGSLKEDSKNTYYLVSRAILTQMKMAPPTTKFAKHVMQTYIDDLFHFGYLAIHDQAHPTPFESLQAILDVAETVYVRAVYQHMWKVDECAAQVHALGSMFFCLAAQYGFGPYMTAKLAKGNTGFVLKQHLGRPALDYALVPNIETDVVHYSENTVKLLLATGADPNQSCKGSTVWLRFLAALAARQIESDQSTITKIVKALVAAQARLGDIMPASAAEASTRTVEIVLREHLSADALTMIPELSKRSRTSKLILRLRGKNAFER